MITKAKSSGMKQKKKQSKSALDSSPSPRFLSIVRSKLSGGRDLKLMFRSLRRKKSGDVSPQASLVRCPKCQKILQEPEDAPVYRCGRCNTVLQAKRWKSEGKVDSSVNEMDAPQISGNSVREAILFSAEQCDSRAEDESADTGSVVSGSKSSIKKTYHEYDAAASSSGKRSYGSETAYKRERAPVPKEWLRRDKFPATNDSDMFVLGIKSPSSVCSSTASRDHIEQGRYENQPRVPFYPASPSPSSAYEYGSPFHESYVSASENTYHHQWDSLRQYEKEGRSGATSRTSSIHFSAETSDARYYQWSGQSPMHHSQYHRFSGQNFYDYNSSCTATPHRSAQSEQSYSKWSPKTESCSQKGTCREINSYVRERTPVVKRHVLPAAGGAPFVTCYYCLKLLQLSQGFLHDKRKRYIVRCGSCSGVLKFSRLEKVHTISYTPDLLDSHPSRGDDNVSNHQHYQDSASEDHKESCADELPLSCSDNHCGDSICKSSLSNDGELVSPHIFQGMTVNEDRQNILNECPDAMSAIPHLQLEYLANEKQMIRENHESDETSGIHLEQSQDAHSEHSWNEYENVNERHELDNTFGDRVMCDLEESGNERSETLDASKIATDGSGVSLEDLGYKNEGTNKTTKESEIIEERLVSHRAESVEENENTCETLELAENTGETCKFDWEKSKEESEYGGERTWEETMGDRPGLHLEEYESSYKDIEGRFSKGPERDAATERVPTFRIDDSVLGKLLEPVDPIEEKSEIYFWVSPNDHENSREALGLDDNTRERAVFHLESSPAVGENQTESIRASETEIPWLHLVKHENESRNFTKMVEPRNEVSSLCLGEQLEQEEKTLAETLFHLDLSQGTRDNLQQTLEPGEEDRSASSSRLYSDDHECSSKLIKLDGETAEHTSGDYSEQLQDEDDKLGLTFEPYAHLCSTMDPSEIVGLRNVLYPMQSSPLRSPFTSPLHTPVGSPRHHLMGSPLHSPMASPLRAHIVSPLRSPITSPSSLTDVLFFSRNC